MLDGESYAVYGVFERGEQATSQLLDGFSISVNTLLDAR